MKAKVPMTAKVASLLIKMAEDPALLAQFRSDADKFTKDHGLSGDDFNVINKLGKSVTVSMLADSSDPFDQNQQMYFFEKKLK